MTYDDGQARFYLGDCREVLPGLEANCVDALVTDPPYGLGFMGKGWDHGVPGEEFWREALRVAKPGAYLLAFGGTRTFHRLMVAIEDAGWELRDTIMWVYGSGFPKSLNIGKSPLFCQCSSSNEPPFCSDDRTGRERPRDPRTNIPLLNDAEDGRHVHHEHDAFDSPAPLSSPAGCLSCRDFDGELLPPERVGDRASVPLPADALAHSHSSELGGDPSAPERKRIPAYSDRPSTQGYPNQSVLGLPCLDCSKPIANGLGTALKPAWEPIVVARKPLQGTAAANVLKFGTGGINVDGCRIEGGSRPQIVSDRRNGMNGTYGDGLGGSIQIEPTSLGRWPANLIHDGSDEVVSLFPDLGATSKLGKVVRHASSKERNGNTSAAYGAESRSEGGIQVAYGDSGSASRFFYCAKASREDREEGLQGFDRVRREDGRKTEHHVPNLRTSPQRNHHPTVKPTSLMRYLCRLVTPPKGLILDPFMGSGSTGKAAILEGFRFIGIELEAEYIPIAEARLEWAAAQPRQEVLAL